MTNSVAPNSGAATNNSATAPADVFAAILDSMAQNFIAGEEPVTTSDVVPANDAAATTVDPSAAITANPTPIPPTLINGAARLQVATLDDETDSETPDVEAEEVASTAPVEKSAKDEPKTDTPDACAVPMQTVAPEIKLAPLPAKDELNADTHEPAAAPAKPVTATREAQPASAPVPPVAVAPMTAPMQPVTATPEQAVAGTDAVAATAATSNTAANTAPANNAAATVAANDVDTDENAASIAVAGTIEKPAKAESAPVRDGEKSQGRRSSATNLADASASAARNFAPHQVNAPATATPAPDNTAHNCNPQTPSHDTAASTTPTVAASDAPPPAPAHTAAAPQPDMTAAVQANAAPTGQPAQAPVHVGAHFQVLQGGTHDAAPDVNSLAVNIATKAEGGARHFDIRLDPAELGRVDVRLTVDDAGRAQASLIVEKPHTLELLQKDSSHLERALKDAGLELTQSGLNFSLKGQQQNADGRAPLPRGRNLAARAIAAAETASTLPHTAMSASDTRLDIRV